MPTAGAGVQEAEPNSKKTIPQIKYFHECIIFYEFSIIVPRTEVYISVRRYGPSSYALLRLKRSWVRTLASVKLKSSERSKAPATTIKSSLSPSSKSGKRATCVHQINGISFDFSNSNLNLLPD